MTGPRFAPPKAVYIHVPFCRHRCGYCNFTLVAGRDDLISSYLEALARELNTLGQPHPVETLFLGGGTPTHLPLAELEQLLRCVQHWLPLGTGAEFTVEANPSDVSQPMVDLLAGYGVTRLSVGAQSFQQSKLTFLERDHRPADIGDAVRLAHAAKLDVSLDLIFGLPCENEAAWESDLQAALQLGVEHLSTYALTYERGTKLWTSLHHGKVQPLQDELEAKLYERGIGTLVGAGFEHYEVSNFARPGHRCLHNLNYWRGGTYLAYGPGAASHVNGVRRVNHRSTTTYLRKVLSGESPVAETEELAPMEAAKERLVFALRMRDGLHGDQFQQETGFSVEQLAEQRIAGLIDLELLERSGPTLRVTPRGLLVCDSIAAELLRE